MTTPFSALSDVGAGLLIALDDVEAREVVGPAQVVCILEAMGHHLLEHRAGSISGGNRTVMV